MRNRLSRLTELFELPGTGARLYPMEGIRGVAVLLVFAVHYVSMVEPWLIKGSAWERSFNALHHLGNSGVDLFFVLSGYLIYGAVLRMRSFGTFMKRRAIRIYPTFLVVFALYLAIMLALPAYSDAPKTELSFPAYLLANILLLPGVFPIEPMVAVAWSLSYEVAFYALLPVVVWLLRVRSMPVPMRIVTWLLFAAAIVTQAQFTSAFERTIMFFSGMILWDLHREAKLACPRGLGLGAFLVAVIFCWIANDDRNLLPFQTSIMFVGYGLFCFECMTRAGVASRAMSVAPLRWLGNASYSFYLIHGFALSVLGVLFAALAPQSWGVPFALAVLPFALAAALVAAAILYLLVERPISLAPRGTATLRVETSAVPVVEKG